MNYLFIIKYNLITLHVILFPPTLDISVGNIRKDERGALASNKKYSDELLATAQDGS